MPRFDRRLLLLPLVACLAVVPGCWTPGGNFVSYDAYTFHSTTVMPQTVTVVDTRTGQPFFSLDIPVGKELVLQFLEGRGTKQSDGTPSELYPDQMVWDVWTIGRELGWPTQRLDCPPAHARRIDLMNRPTPEGADALKPTLIGAPQAQPGGAAAPGPNEPTRPQVPAPQDAPSMAPAPAPVPPGPGKPVEVGDGQG